MDLNHESFNNVIASGKDINGIPLAHFLYTVSKYYEDNKIVENYLINEELKNRLKEIKSSEQEEDTTTSSNLSVILSYKSLSPVNSIACAT